MPHPGPDDFKTPVVLSVSDENPKKVFFFLDTNADLDGNPHAQCEVEFGGWCTVAHLFYETGLSAKQINTIWSAEACSVSRLCIHYSDRNPNIAASTFEQDIDDECGLAGVYVPFALIEYVKEIQGK